MSYKIVILGAGAMGSLYASKLSTLDGVEVCVVDIWQEHVDNINEGGLIVESGGESKSYRNIHGYFDSERIVDPDLVIIFVKSTMTGSTVAAHKKLFTEKTAVLTLQNGLGNTDELSKVVKPENILAGTTAHGATILGPGRIVHAGSGKTVIGELDGGISKRADHIADIFNKAGLETEVSPDVLSLIWDKLFVNVGINALTAITGLKNGELLKHEELGSILEAAVNEAVNVAKAKKINIVNDDPVLHVKEVCRATAENRSSMLQDISGGRKTEIAMINGAIVKEAEKLEMSAPVNSVMTNLVKFLEKNKDN